MINEELFQKVLTNRAQLQNKGTRINTKVAVTRLRNKLEALTAKGYDQDAMMNLMLEKGWLGIQEHWLQGKLTPKHLTAPRSISDAIQPILASTRLPTSNYQKKHDHANQVRQTGRDALDEMNRVLKR